MCCDFDGGEGAGIRWCLKVSKRKFLKGCKREIKISNPLVISLKYITISGFFSRGLLKFLDLKKILSDLQNQKVKSWRIKDVCKEDIE